MDFDYLFVWKNGRSWNWHFICEDDYELLESKYNDDRWDEGFDYLFNDKECVQVIEKAVKVDDNATIIHSDELNPDFWTCESLMKKIKSIYGKEDYSLTSFYGACCVD